MFCLNHRSIKVTLFSKIHIKIISKISLTYHQIAFLKIKTDNPDFSVSELTALRLKRLALILLFHFFYDYTQHMFKPAFCFRLICCSIIHAIIEKHICIKFNCILFWIFYFHIFEQVLHVFCRCLFNTLLWHFILSGLFAILLLHTPHNTFKNISLAFVMTV